jgi:predicted AAA+ superfamily ATPase
MGMTKVRSEAKGEPPLPGHITVVIEGPRCSGKSTLLNYLKHMYEIAGTGWPPDKVDFVEKTVQ